MLTRENKKFLDLVALRTLNSFYFDLRIAIAILKEMSIFIQKDHQEIIKS
jgi:hypothetical protein